MSTKLHLLVDALGHPLRVILTAGQVADICCAQDLIEALHFDALIADKGYDANALIAFVKRAGAEAVIPPRTNRTDPRSYDETAYRERNLVERFFGRIKQFRRIATRYDKLDTSYMAFLQLTCAVKRFA